MKITFKKKLEGSYIFNQAKTDVQLEQLEEAEWTKLKMVFAQLKEFRNADGARKAGYGVLKLTTNGPWSFLTDPDEQMPKSVQQALALTKKTVPALPVTLLDTAPVLQPLIAAAWNTVPLAKTSDCYLTIGLLRYDQTHEGIGPHKDGAQYVTTHLISRHKVEGAQSTFYRTSSENSLVETLELTHQLDSITFNDREIYHGVTPITVTELGGYRDIIVLGFHPGI